jgi:hypothetical protein
MAASLVTSTAAAAVITYNFAGSDANLGTTETFTVDGVSINVFGYTYTRAGFGGGTNTFRQADIVRVSGALGIDNSNVPGGSDNTSEIDNSGWYDLLLIQLPSNAGPMRIEFSSRQGGDEWIVGWNDDLSVSTTSPATLFSSLMGSATGGAPPFYNFAGPLDPSINWIFVGGANLTASSDDDFYVDLLRIRTVPEPASIALLGASLLLLAAFRGRRKR